MTVVSMGYATPAQEELVRAQTVRERLPAVLAPFFAVVAVLLAGASRMVCAMTRCCHGGV
jgi:hypothetical protein